MPSKAPVIIASLAALAYIGGAPDASAMDQGFYVGGYYGSLSRSNSKGKDADNIASLSRDFYDTFDFDTVSQSPRLSVDDQSFGFLGGFRWTPNLAFEIGYVDLGQITYRSDDVIDDLQQPTPTLSSVNMRWRGEVSAFTISALGIWPLTYEWELFGRAGFALTGTKARIRVEDSHFSDSKDGFDLLAGAGISYTFLDVYTVRGEWQRVFDTGKSALTSKSDIDLLSIGFVVTF